MGLRSKALVGLRSEGQDQFVVFMEEDPGARRVAEFHLNRMATVLEGCERFLTSIRDVHNDKPAAMSPMAKQIEEESNWSTADLTHPVTDAFGYAAIGLVAATDHLLVLARAIRPPPRPLAPPTLARQAVELSARSWYLLDPDIDAGRRAAPLATELLYSLWEDEQHDAVMADGSTPTHASDVIVRWAEEVGIETHTNKRTTRRWVGPDERLPAHRIVKQMMGDIGNAGYGIFSGTSHGTVGGFIRQLTAEQAPDAPEGIGARISVSVNQIALLTSWTLHGFLIAAGRFLEISGWNDHQADDWRRHALKTVREAGIASGLFSPDDPVE